MKTLDFRTIQEEFDQLINQTTDKLEQEWSSKYPENIVNGGKFTIVSLFKISLVNYGGVVGLTNLSEEQCLNIYLAAPSINRAILENLFTLIYLLDDFPKNNKLFIKNSLRERKEKLDFHQNHFGNNPKWKNYLIDEKTKCDYYENFVNNTIGLTKTEKNNPEQIQRFPRVSKVVKYFDKKNSSEINFLKYLEDYYYVELSQLAHSQPSGLIKTGNILENKIINWKFFNEQRWISIALILSFISEIENHFHYGLSNQLNEIWQFMEDYSDYSLEVYQLRYKNLLAE